MREAFFTAGQAQAIKRLCRPARWWPVVSEPDVRHCLMVVITWRPFADLLPVQLPQRKDTFQRNFVAAELTDAGSAAWLCRIEDDAEKSNRHWDILPYLANYQDPGTPKPGAVVLANVDAAANGFRC